MVTFTYRSIGSDSEAERSVEPYGLFFVSSHWYLAGRDTAKDEIRNFRLSRISDLKLNPARAQSRDYEIPSGFHLREHARSRQPWELGDGDLTEAVVRFSRITGANAGAARLGEQIPGELANRRFRIRRQDAFSRWLLSFGGDAVPVSPASLVRDFASLVKATSKIYKGVKDD
jgi:proteasome accessory factor B